MLCCESSCFRYTAPPCDNKSGRCENKRAVIRYDPKMDVFFELFILVPLQVPTQKLDRPHVVEHLIERKVIHAERPHILVSGVVGEFSSRWDLSRQAMMVQYE